MTIAARMMLAESLAYSGRLIWQATRQGAFLAALAAALAIWPTWPALAETWSKTADYEHGALVALIAAIWLLRSSMKVAGEATARIWPAAVCLAMALAVWLVAYKANVEIGKQALAPLIILLAVATACGWGAARAIAPPVAYLYFAIPVWDLAVPLLQWMTVLTTRVVFGLMGVPVTISGIVVHIPEGTFIVQEDCSGKRYLIVALSLAVILAAASPVTRRRKLAYIAAAGGLALLVNWIRVIIVIYAGHVTNMKHYFVSREHISLGWGMFLLLLLAIMWMGARFRRNAAREASGARRAPDATPTCMKLTPARATTAVALLCVPVIGVAYDLARSQNLTLERTPWLAQASGGWRPSAPASTDWMPQFTGASDSFRGAFVSSDGHRVEIYTAVYVAQRPGAELIQYANSVLGLDWSVIGGGLVPRTLRGGAKVTVTSLEARAPAGALWNVEFFYDVDGINTTNEWQAQLTYGLWSWWHTVPSAVVALAARCNRTCDDAQKDLVSHWRDVKTPAWHLAEARH